MRILLCSNYPVYTGTGGAEKVFWEMGDHFAAQGSEVMCLGFEKGADPKLPSFHPHGPLVKAVNPGRFYRKSRAAHLLAALMAFTPQMRRRFRDAVEGRRKGRLIQGFISSFKPDVIVSYQAEMTYVLRHSLKTAIPVVTALHCDIDTLLKGKQRLLPALASSEAIVVLQRTYIADLGRYIDPSRAVFIPNAVEQQEGNCDPDSRVIAMSGRVCPQKNQLLAIRAFAIFLKKHPGWTLRVFGDTDYDKAYHALCKNVAASLGVSSSIEFKGIARHVREELEKCSIFAFPSIFEGFSLALTEAMAIGLPCVCLKSCAGMAEIVENGNNGLLSDASPEAFSAVLSMLADDPGLRQRIGLAARKSMEEYSPDRIWAQWDKLVREAASMAGAGRKA